MKADWKGASGTGTVLRVDGGMTASDWTMQRLADMLDAPVDRPKVLETTALGAGYLAGWKAGVYGPPETFARRWRRQKRFRPAITPDEREAGYRSWCDAVRRTLGPLG
jgi:glycerol kinase